MTFRVYGLDEALATVSVPAGSSVDGSTFGKSAANSAATASPIAVAVPTNDQPSRRTRLKARPATRASAAATASPTVAGLKRRFSVQARNATASAAATTPT